MRPSLHSRPDLWRLELQTFAGQGEDGHDTVLPRPFGRLFLAVLSCAAYDKRILVGHSDGLCRTSRPVEQECVHLDRDFVHGASVLAFVIDVVRSGIYLCGKAGHDEVEEFTHQDSGNSTSAFEEAP